QGDPPFKSSTVFFSSRRRHTSFSRDWSSDVCSSDLGDPDVRRQAEAIPSFLFNLFAAAAEVPTARVIITLATGQDAFGKETTEEIGRASCRERGERSGGAASARSRKTRGLATK